VHEGNTIFLPLPSAIFLPCVLLFALFPLPFLFLASATLLPSLFPFLFLSVKNVVEEIYVKERRTEGTEERNGRKKGVRDGWMGWIAEKNRRKSR
jgi:hypothetical protein